MAEKAGHYPFQSIQICRTTMTGATEMLYLVPVSMSDAVLNMINVIAQ